ncbi:hypothetical protein S245_070406, partial [Arachis hypogaea]
MVTKDIIHAAFDGFNAFFAVQYYYCRDEMKDGAYTLQFLAEERHTEILGRLLYTAKLVAKQEGLDDGFKIVINDGPKG